ncbi:branched-chain amino acid ABC transporter permease [Methylobacter sp.]|uniref:branched-chain amino acid ABC transporter permease n=1 Tax=Methylobacter sp. TaxID=2051955 RepID=UPI002FDCCB6D
MNYLYHLIIYFEIYAIVAMSLNLLIGYGGLLQVAHAAYYGIGAYTAALLWTKLGWGFFPGLAVGAFAAGVLSLLVSLPAWRFKGDYFVMISIAVQTLIYATLYNWTDLTNGPFGISGIARPVMAGYSFVTTGSITVLYGVLATGLGMVMALLKWSPFGRALQAMRDDELAAYSIGIPVNWLKLQAFALASAMVGIAGGLYASYVSYIDPTSFSLDESILMLSMVVIGGTGNVRGPLTGAAVLILLPEALRFLQLPDAVAANVRLLAYGLLLILMMHLRPQGLAGTYRYQ